MTAHYLSQERPRHRHHARRVTTAIAANTAIGAQSGRFRTGDLYVPWTRGVSGNPGGRPRAIVEVVELARQETAASVAALVRVRDAEGTPPAAVVAAATALLDRAWGRPPQAITTDPATSAATLHLLAANSISQQLAAAFEQRTIIAGRAELSDEPTARDLLAAPLPLE